MPEGHSCAQGLDRSGNHFSRFCSKAYARKIADTELQQICQHLGIVFARDCGLGFKILGMG